MDTSSIKCTPEECLHVTKRAYAAHALLADERELRAQARRFQALGNATRLRILALLSVRELCTCDIVAATGEPPATIAHHLRMLREAELITVRRVSKFTLYVLAEHVLAWQHVFDIPVREHQVVSSDNPQ